MTRYLKSWVSVFFAWQLNQSLLAVTSCCDFIRSSPEFPNDEWLRDGLLTVLNSSSEFKGCPFVINDFRHDIASIHHTVEPAMIGTLGGGAFRWGNPSRRGGFISLSLYDKHRFAKHVLEIESQLRDQGSQRRVRPNSPRVLIPMKRYDWNAQKMFGPAAY